MRILQGPSDLSATLESLGCARRWMVYCLPGGSPTRCKSDDTGLPDPAYGPSDDDWLSTDMVDAEVAKGRGDWES